MNDGYFAALCCLTPRPPIVPRELAGAAAASKELPAAQQTAMALMAATRRSSAHMTNMGKALSSGAYQLMRRLSMGSASRQDGLLPRLYTDVDVKLEGEDWHVLLDGRLLKTPGRKDLRVPTQSLALAIAAEWEYQDSRSIRPFTMPLMSLAATAIDQPKAPSLVIDTLMRYLHTDSLGLREDGHPTLRKKQEELYKPIMDFYSDHFKLEVVTTSAILGIEQPEATTAALRSYLESLDSWHLATVESLSATSRSVLIGVALMHDIMGPQEALKIARLEENLQMEEWGLVEGGHDIDDADYRVRVSAPLVFLQLLKG